MSKVNDFLSEAGVFFLATVDGDQPKCRPLGAHMEMDGKVIFGVGDFKNVYKHQSRTDTGCVIQEKQYLRLMRNMLRQCWRELLS